MQANPNTAKTNRPETYDQVLLRGYCTMDASELEKSFVSYVRIGNEVIARTKNGGYISYFNVR